MVERVTSLPVGVSLFGVTTAGWGAAMAAGGGWPLGSLVVASLFLGALTTTCSAVAFAILRAVLAPPPALRLEPGEITLATRPATHWSGFESRGGTVVVTDRALHFVPRRLTFDRSTREVQWVDLRDVRADTFAARGPLAGVVVVHRSGSEVFQVPDREAFLAEVLALRAVAAPG
jgi:hypothetical protein